MSRNAQIVATFLLIVAVISLNVVVGRPYLGCMVREGWLAKNRCTIEALSAIWRP